MDEKKMNELPEEALNDVAGGVIIKHQNPPTVDGDSNVTRMRMIMQSINERVLIQYPVKTGRFGQRICSKCEKDLPSGWGFKLCLDCAEQLAHGK